ncbi:MAG: SRPBCC domain-containing protein [Ignavibacteriales bacterium]|nr:SRPBCC domain-containing protein [Ignavibacteriales bacterium]MBI3787836.1 SRPBCC domain-containing protein [Ignavibacteriales bacterium]
MKSSPIKMTIELPASPDEVFAALTEPKLITRWCGQKGKAEAKVGGKFEMFDGWVKGKVVESKPGKALSYTWQPTDWEKKIESVVKYTLTKSKKGTKITLVHFGFPDEKERGSHASGWKKHVFDPLKEYFGEK